MLAPGDRRLLLDALAPPEGYHLYHAIGTTYTLDLLALLRVPLAATALPWARADGEAVDNPFALLTALRQNAGRVSLFCHAGAIRVPPRLQPLLTFLEGSVHSVTAPGPGVFHPKCWLLRFSDDDGTSLLRLVVLSRNLTFDRSWDIALVLEGTVGGRRHVANRPLEAFFSALPAMAYAAGTELDSATTARVELLADEARRANWELPDDFSGAVGFHALGSVATDRDPLADFLRLLVISPFVSAEALDQIVASTRGEVSLVARFEELAKLPASALESLHEVWAFDDEQHLIDTSGGGGESAGSATDGEDSVDLRGLHAKVFVGEADRRAFVLVGSANATRAGLSGENVELLVELEGSRVAHGIDTVLGGLKDAQLIKAFKPGEPLPDDSRAGAKRALERLAHELSCGAIRGTVTEEDGRYRVDIHIELAPSSTPPMRLEIRPLSDLAWRPADVQRAPAVSFPPVSAPQVTAFCGVRITQLLDGEELAVEFVARIPLEGAPAGRAEAVTAELLSDRDRLLRFLMLLLADTPGDSDAILDELAVTAERGAGPPQGDAGSPLMPLLEPLLRTMHREPERLDEVARLIADIRQHGATGVLPPELDSLWSTIAAVRRA
jgi:hypothetical protein